MCVCEIAVSDALDRIVPEDNTKRGDLYRHSAEGKDDMPVSSHSFPTPSSQMSFWYTKLANANL